MIYSLIVIDVQVCIWFSAKSEPQDLCRIGGLNIAISISNIAVYFIKIAGMDTQNYKLCLFLLTFMLMELNISWTPSNILVPTLRFLSNYTEDFSFSCCGMGLGISNLNTLYSLI